MHKRVNFTILVLAATITLSACEGTKEQLGLTRQTPDEFAVMKRAPLEMPPEYKLHAPSPGAPRPQEQQSKEQARSVVFGNGTQKSAASPASGEAALLQQAGTDIAQPGIRETVDQETATLAPKEQPVAEKLLGLTLGKDKTEPATVVDAEAEAARLKKNREEGKPATEGDTPSREE